MADNCPLYADDRALCLQLIQHQWSPPRRANRSWLKSAFQSPDRYLSCLSQDGTLCLDLIQDQWSPVQSVSTLLTSVQSLLTDPNCSVSICA